MDMAMEGRKNPVIMPSPIERGRASAKWSPISKAAKLTRGPRAVPKRAMTIYSLKLFPAILEAMKTPKIMGNILSGVLPNRPKPKSVKTVAKVTPEKVMPEKCMQRMPMVATTTALRKAGPIPSIAMKSLIRRACFI